MVAYLYCRSTPNWGITIQFELVSINLRARYNDFSELIFEARFDLAAVMGGNVIRKDENRSLVQVLVGGEEFDDLLGANGALPRSLAREALSMQQFSNGLCWNRCRKAARSPR